MLRHVFRTVLSRSTLPSPFRMGAFPMRSFADEAAKPAEEKKAEEATKQATEPEKQIAELQKKVLDHETKLKELHNDYLRAMADAENARRVAAKDVSNAREYGGGEFAKSLLPVADNLEHALKSVPKEALQDKLLNSFYEGVSMTQTTLVNSLKRIGVTRIEADIGTKFNPNQHNAVFEQNVADAEPGTISLVIKPGYMIKDRVLRAADVGVVGQKS